MTTPHPPTSAPPLPTARQFLTSLFNAISEIPLVGGRNANNSDESSSDESDDLPPRGASQEGGGGRQRRKATLSRRRQRRLLLLQDGGGSVQGVGNMAGPGGGGTGNVLKQVPVSHRHLIITLHVLFPGLVLPALDLLDRGLVGRIILQQQQQQEQQENTTVKNEERARAIQSERGRQQTSLSGEWNIKAEEDGNQDGGGFTQPSGGGNQKEAENEKEKPAAAAAAAVSFYLVRSAQPTSHHHRHRRRRQQQRSGYVSGGGGEEEYPAAENKNGNNLFPGGQRAYIVRLDAWNCTCAAFAFALFSDPAAEAEDITTTTTTTTAKAGGGERASSSVAGTVTVTRNPGAAVDQERENVRMSSIISSTPGQSLANQEGGNKECVDDKMDIDQPLPRAQEEMSEILPNTAATASGPNDEGDVGDVEEGWSFGGMSLSQRGDGDDSPPPPLCKHLLACLLAERWKDALGRYVIERQVSKEAMAGIVAEI